MATCRGCIHWNKCSIASDSTTHFYGKKAAANNVEELCVLFVPTKLETDMRKRLNIISMEKDITLKPQVKRYRKKPVIVEAYQTDKELIIHTLEGDMKANVGDYIITGVKGEQYPCKPDIFYATYEAVESEVAERREDIEKTPPVCFLPDLVHCSECRHGQQVGDLGVVCEYGCEEYRPFDHFCGWGERRDFASDTEDE